jgi:carboxymethylenebutenolidase
MGDTLTFPRTDGAPTRAYLAEPGAAQAPGVVVIQEWWGLQGQIMSVCDRLAGAGFRALAPDLFGGKVIPYHDRDAARAAMGALDFRAAAELTVLGAVRHLKSRGGKVGAIGFCMGGAIAVVAAVHVPELDAAVCFYGLPPESAAAPKDVRVPLQAHFAAIDTWCTPALVDEFERKLGAAGEPFEVHRYEGKHAFMNSDRPEVYDARAAQLAQERCLAFLGKHLA